MLFIGNGRVSPIIKSDKVFLNDFFQSTDENFKKSLKEIHRIHDDLEEQVSHSALRFECEFVITTVSIDDDDNSNINILNDSQKFLAQISKKKCTTSTLGHPHSESAW